MSSCHNNSTKDLNPTIRMDTSQDTKTSTKPSAPVKQTVDNSAVNQVVQTPLKKMNNDSAFASAFSPTPSLSLLSPLSNKNSNGGKESDNRNIRNMKNLNGRLKSLSTCPPSKLPSLITTSPQTTILTSPKQPSMFSPSSLTNSNSSSSSSSSIFSTPNHLSYSFSSPSSLNNSFSSVSSLSPSPYKSPIVTGSYGQGQSLVNPKSSSSSPTVPSFLTFSSSSKTIPTDQSAGKTQSFSVFKTEKEQQKKTMVEEEDDDEDFPISTSFQTSYSSSNLSSFSRFFRDGNFPQLLNFNDVDQDENAQVNNSSSSKSHFSDLSSSTSRFSNNNEFASKLNFDDEDLQDKENTPNIHQANSFNPFRSLREVGNLSKQQAPSRVYSKYGKPLSLEAIINNQGALLFKTTILGKECVIRWLNRDSGLGNNQNVYDFVVANPEEAFIKVNGEILDLRKLILKVIKPNEQRFKAGDDAKIFHDKNNLLCVGIKDLQDAEAKDKSKGSNSLGIRSVKFYIQPKSLLENGLFAGYTLCQKMDKLLFEKSWEGQTMDQIFAASSQEKIHLEWVKAVLTAFVMAGEELVGDFRPGNVMLDDKGNRYIVDAEKREADTCMMYDYLLDWSRSNANVFKYLIKDFPQFDKETMEKNFVEDMKSNGGKFPLTKDQQASKSREASLKLTKLNTVFGKAAKQEEASAMNSMPVTPPSPIRTLGAGFSTPT